MTAETIDKKRANKETEIMKSEKHNRMKMLISWEHRDGEDGLLGQPH